MKDYDKKHNHPLLNTEVNKKKDSLNEVRSNSGIRKIHKKSLDRTTSPPKIKFLSNEDNDKELISRENILSNFKMKNRSSEFHYNFHTNEKVKILQEKKKR